MLNNKFLLSIIIPTKNRQYTCIYAIESVLLLNNDDIEIIVQDCSDSNILEKRIVDEFGVNDKISYEYVNTRPSMTDNWNRAFERATGVYKCGIGDDDAVLPNIYNIAKWANENNIEAVGHSKKYIYHWPDFTLTPEYASKLMLMDTSFPENVKIYEREDLNQLLQVQAAMPDMNYTKLPMVYHCLLASSLIENLIEKTGKFLDGTSLDVYSAFSFGLLANKFYVYDIPFTLMGVCGTSNSSRVFSKNYKNHFSEFKKIISDERIPNVYNLTFTIVESTQKAFKALNDTIYSQLLYLPYVYADFLCYSFNIRMIKDLHRLMRENKFTTKDYVSFIRNFIILFFSKRILGLGSRRLIKKILFSFKYLKKIISKRNKKYTLYESNNILGAIDILISKNML
jgi:glycosyltransferase involved in cell wall biosynthesis